MSQVEETGNGLGFIRNWNNGQSVAVVGLAAGGDQTFTVRGAPSGTYRDAVTGGTIVANDGTLTFTVRAQSAGIWVLNGPGKLGEDGPFLRLTPALEPRSEA